MDRERWEEIKQIHNSALEIRAGRREESLRETCGGDISLRREIESLLARQAKAGRRRFSFTPPGL
jgi:hypothetical protein